MDDTPQGLTTQQLGLLEELILMLLSEQTGYFHQVPGWELNCAVVVGVLAELSLLERADTDMESLFLVDKTETGHPAPDPILKQIADEPVRRNAQYWIERFALQAESVIDLTLERLVELKILEHHDGDFWTLAPVKLHADKHAGSLEDTADEFIKTRISKYIFTDLVPNPRDIIICLVNTCDVFRFIFELDEKAEERIKFICKMDLIGRSIADAVEQNIASPLLRRAAPTKKIPVVSMRKILLNPHTRKGNVSAVFADLAQEYGPVFQFRPPFQEPATILAGAAVNRWIHRNGRMYLKSRNYFTDIEKVYGASGLLPSLDGADHFRLRKTMQPGYSREKLGGQLHELHPLIRKYMADWKVGVLATGGRHVPAHDQRAGSPAHPQRRVAGHRRGPDQVQGVGAHHPRRQAPAQVPVAHPGHEGPRQGHRSGGATDPERPHAGPACRLPAYPGG